MRTSRYFFGERVLATNGVDLPILNVFRMYAKMDGQRVASTSDHAVSLDNILRSGVHGDPDVGALSTLGKNKLCVMVWHYHDDIVPGPDATVSLNLTGLPADAKQVKITHYRIDDTHSNAYTAWQNHGLAGNPDARAIRATWKMPDSWRNWPRQPLRPRP